MHGARPGRVLPVIVLAQFAGTSLWFAGNAVLPDLERALGLAPGAVASITSAVQLGFIAGTLVFAVSHLADRFSPRHVFLACAAMGALANGAAAFVAPGEGAYGAILAARFATGFFLAGIYPVGMKIAASWYEKGLGGALGWLIGALVLGTAFPHLLKGLGQALPWTTVTLSLSALALAGGLALVALVPESQHHPRASRFDLRALASVFTSPALRASAFGYFGHMWELYTYWALVPLLLAAHAASHGTAGVNASLWSFLIIAAGTVGCVAGGFASHRVGSARVAFAQLSVSGLCCLVSPAAFLLPFPFYAAFLVMWGVCVVGDSPQFSALTAAAAPREFVGSALTFVNCIGFSLTIASIQLATALAAHLPPAWWFVPVAIGPALGLIAVRPLAAR